MSVLEAGIEVKSIKDPREVSFAGAVIEEFGRALSRTPALIQQVMAGAASAAEDLNVEPYQGLIEVLQNADDLGAKEVRFAVREFGKDRQLLVVHDGAPVNPDRRMRGEGGAVNRWPDEIGRRREPTLSWRSE
jgi:hypothetical protein